MMRSSHQCTIDTMSSSSSMDSPPSSPSSWSPAKQQKNRKVVTLFYYEKTMRSIISHLSGQRSELRKLCEVVLNDIARNSHESLHLASVFDRVGGMEDPLRSVKTNPHQYFTPLLLAIQTIRKVSVLRLLFDCLQKLLSARCVPEENDDIGGAIINNVCCCYADEVEKRLDNIETISVATDILNTLLCTILTCRVHGEGLTRATQTCFSICMNSSDDLKQTSHPTSVSIARQSCLKKAQNTLVQILNVCIERSLSQPDNNLHNEFQIDVVLLLRIICNLSMKEVATTREDVAIEIQLHRLALKILKKVLQTSAHKLSSSDFFCNYVKLPMVQSLLINLTYGNTVLFKKSITIVKILVEQCRQRMKLELELLLRITFHLLPVSGSALQKEIIQSLSDILCRNPVTLIELFSLFDCNTLCHNVIHELLESLQYVIKNDATMRNDSLKFLIQLLCAVRKCDSKSTNEYPLALIRERKQDFQSFMKHYNTVNEEVAIKLFKQNHFINDEDEDVALFLHSNGLDRSRTANLLCSHPELLHRFVDNLFLKNRDIVLSTYMYLQTINLDIRQMKHDVLILEFVRKFKRDNVSSILKEEDLMFLVKCIVDCIRNKQTTLPHFQRSFLSYDKNVFSDEFVRKCYEQVRKLPDIDRLSVKSRVKGSPSSFNQQPIVDEMNYICRQYVPSSVLSGGSILPKNTCNSDYILSLFELILEYVHPLVNSPDLVSIDAYSTLTETCCVISIEHGMNKKLYHFIASLANRVTVLSHSDETFKYLKILFRLAGEYGNQFENCWIQVFRCIAFIVNQKLPNKDSNNQLHHQLFYAYSVDLWPKTSQLSEQGFYEFLEYLMEYLSSPIEQESKIFFTNLLPEILSYNLHRPKQEIKKFWKTISHGLCDILTQKNTKGVILCAINCLKALGLSMLSRNFVTIIEILDVFMNINSTSDKIYVMDAVVQSVGTIMVSLPKTVDCQASKHIIQILAISVKIGSLVHQSQTIEEREILEKFLIVQHAFANLSALVHQNFDVVIYSDCYKDCIACIRIFLEQSHEVITIQTIELLEFITLTLVNNAKESSMEGVLDDSDESRSLWIPLLHTLSDRVNRDMIYGQEYWALSKTLKSIQALVSPGLGQAILNDIILPMSEEMKLVDISQFKDTNPVGHSMQEDYALLQIGYANPK